MKRTLLLLSLVLSACSAQVGDLDDLEENVEACDPRGDERIGRDLDLQFDGLTPHVNQEMFFAVTVNPEQRNIEAMMVLSTLDDPDLHLVVPKLLPEGSSEIAFWADSMPAGFNDLEDEAVDHQWTRPVCPDGRVHFVHTPVFQSVKDATSTGAIFQFVFPEEVATNTDLFGTYRMWVRAILLDDDDESQDLQTRAFYRWAPLVDVPDDEQRLPKDGRFQVGGNALGEPRGAIDQLALYRIEFVIDVDEDGVSSRGDFKCSFERQQAPDSMTWAFEPDLSQCDAPDDFDPATFRR